MGRMLGLLLLLAGVSGVLAQTDMTDKVFLFPEESVDSYVRLKPAKNGPFDKLTVCLRSYSELTRSHSLFSLVTPSGDNDFVLYIDSDFDSYRLSVSVGIKGLYYNLTDSYTLQWRSTCVSWDSSTGIIQLWVNGKPYPRKVFQKGYKINANPIIVIGQDQYDGQIYADYSFVGEITDVHMYDEILSEQNIRNVLYYSDIGGNVINWKSLEYSLGGNVTMQQYLCDVYYGSACSPDHSGLHTPL
ncbi:C-reactive protein-like [Ascaphus truei]|uniref:C-reactive protein-like n=1 Tax=Ascaphus truei TaxID=8439 RepID=UPI003F5963AB